MIDTKTLEKVSKLQHHLQEARRITDDLYDIEGNEWQPGMGEKPHRMKIMQELRNDLIDALEDVDRIYS